MIEKLVDIIYSPDQEGLDAAFIEVLDFISNLLQKMQQEGYLVNMIEELTSIQNAYMKKDYLELADLLLYDIRPKIERLTAVSENFKEEI